VESGKIVIVMKTKARQGTGSTVAARWAGVLLAAAILVWSGVADAARVLEVRVGRHPDFTRVVLELDTPAGYKIERSEPKPGVSELVVSLEASANARRIAGGNRQIESVTVEPAGPGRSVIRIRLSRGGLRLKEMILAGPPRIVLDVLSGEPETRTAAKPAATKTAAAKPSATKTAAKPAATKAATKPAPTKVAAKPAPAPEPEAPSKPAPSASLDLGPMPESLRAPSPAPTAARPLAEPAPVAPPPSEAKTAAEAAARAPGAEAPEPTQVAMAKPGERAEAEMPTRPPPPAARPVPRPVPTPPARLPEPGTEGSLFSLQNMALAAGAVLLVAGGLLLMRRRRSAAHALEPSEADALGEANPFEGFGGSAAEDRSETGDATEAATYFDEGEATTDVGGFPSGSSAEPSLFDVAADTGAAKGAKMQTAASGFETAGAATAVGDDVMRLIRELERRVTSLESRLDEAVDAKERLERQVAAQTEELRVQRAAIARTQRAVRNLSRSDDEGATEPAKRED